MKNLFIIMNLFLFSFAQLAMDADDAHSEPQDEITNISPGALLWANLNFLREHKNLKSQLLTDKFFEGSHLSNLSLPNAKLLNINFRKAKLQKINLKNAYLFMANFCDAEIYEVNLYAANCSQANFNGTIFMNTILTKADLDGADFSFANLSEVNLVGAQVNNTIFGGAYYIDSHQRIISVDLEWLKAMGTVWNPSSPPLF